MADTADPAAVVRRLLAALDRNDAAALRGLVAADHVEHPHWHEPLPLPGDEGQPVLDRYEQADAAAQLDWAGMRTTVEEQVACGDRVATVWTAEATHRASGARVVFRGIAVDRVAGGRVVETWGSHDRLGLYQQLGVVGPTRELAERAGLHL